MAFAPKILMVLALDIFLAATWTGWSNSQVKAPPNNTQAIAILWGDQTTIGGETRRRMRHALDLRITGFADVPILCIGGQRESIRANGAATMCRILAEVGVPLDKLIVGSGSNDTVSNLNEVKTLARVHSLDRVAVVADPLQAFRGQNFIAASDQTIFWTAYPVWKIPPLKLWWRVHTEWLAIISLLLPERLRVFILSLSR